MPWDHPGSLRIKWYRWDSLGCLGINRHHLGSIDFLGSLGITWDHLDHLGSYGTAGICFRSLGITWDHMVPLGFLGITWDQPGSCGIKLFFGITWHHLGSIIWIGLDHLGSNRLLSKEQESRL